MQAGTIKTTKCVVCHGQKLKLQHHRLLEAWQDLDNLWHSLSGSYYWEWSSNHSHCNDWLDDLVDSFCTCQESDPTTDQTFSNSTCLFLQEIGIANLVANTTLPGTWNASAVKQWGAPACSSVCAGILWIRQRVSCELLLIAVPHELLFTWIRSQNQFHEHHFAQGADPLVKSPKSLPRLRGRSCFISIDRQTIPVFIRQKGGKWNHELLFWSAGQLQLSSTKVRQGKGAITGRGSPVDLTLVTLGKGAIMEMGLPVDLTMAERVRQTDFLKTSDQVDTQSPCLVICSSLADLL